MRRQQVIRLAAFLSAVLIAVAAWVLGSPLFIRTTLAEPLPAATPAVTVSSDGGPGVVAAPTPSQATTTNQLQRGTLQYVDALHNGKGTVLHEITSSCCPAADREFIRFEDVTITNAPDVHVYLSHERGGKWSDATSVYLGPLKATNGSFNYDIPAPFGQQPYGSVIVWCRAFSVLVTWADLSPP